MLSNLLLVCRYANGVGRTYRYYNSSNPLGPPLFPFGYGLSYTTFEIEWETNPTESMCANCGDGGRLSASAKVTNTGNCAGSKVVMAFVAEVTPRHLMHSETDCGGMDCDLLAPQKSLYGMQKVHLAPGQSAVVSFATDIVPGDSSEWCTFCTVSHNGTRMVSPGQYRISIGGDGSTHTSGEISTVIDIQTFRSIPIVVPLMAVDSDRYQRK